MKRSRSMIPSKYLVYNKLKELKTNLLQKQYEKGWNETNPTYGYCYIVSEAIYHYSEEKNIKAYCMNLGDMGTHWFLKLDEKIIDYTSDQFPFELDYAKAIGKGFMKGSIKTSNGYISKRGYEMAKHLELTS